ncbi:hypothetical protein BGZ60DRAFT_399909 [Tricladium varicosporioides]|nr:hypothetical protein BGZ60DRAFT_399909 [Hymenoscyphus varicosporioides]
MSPTGSSSGSKAFKNFWHKSSGSTEKSTSKKLKFMPNVTKPGNGKENDDPAQAALDAKQHRRAQVRKAQIEHRQRKANYVKQLEQDVIDLREMIAAAEAEALAAKQENEAIRQAMLNSNINPPPSNIEQLPIPQQDTFVFDIQSQSQDTPNFSSNPSPSQQWPSSDTSPNSHVSIGYDDFVDANCLQISPFDTYDPAPEIISSPDIFGSFPNSSVATPPQAFSASNMATANHASPPQESKHDQDPDLETIAINFILALEHPCRTHFHHKPYDTFNPSTPETNHELMASTLLYSSAPESTFSDPNPHTGSWISPSNSVQTLQKLKEMSRSLPKSDWEITPVQAWFLLVERWGVERIVGQLGKAGLISGVEGAEEKEVKGFCVVEKLKKGLARVVDCFAFGAVMDERRFWEVVRGVVGEEEKGAVIPEVGPGGKTGWI